MDDSLLIFESTNKFYRECTNEIEKLINFSKNDSDNTQLFISSAIVLLGAKFENCIESIIAEYIDLINEESDKDKIPEELLYSSIHKKLCQIKPLNEHFDGFTTDLEYLESFRKFVNEIVDNPNHLEVNNKFNYGNHGYNELVKLFKNIAVNVKADNFNVFENDGLFGFNSNQTTFESEFNKFVNHRNTVVHNNECPNITYTDVGGTVSIFKAFIQRIDSELNERLVKMK